MKGWLRHGCIAVFATLALLGGPRAALAACTSPAGTAGTITWNGTDSVIWCNGTTWYALKDAASGGGGSTSPAFSVKKNADQSITGSTWTKLTWQTELFDTANNFASDKFTPNVAGKYLVSASAFGISSASPGDSLYLAFYKNGSYLVDTRVNGYTSSSLTYIVDMNGSTDYVEVYAQMSSNATIYGAVSAPYSVAASFSGSLIGGAVGGGGGSTTAAGSTGEIQFNGGSSAFAADSGLNWDNTNKRLGIGTAVPTVKLSVTGVSEALGGAGIEGIAQFTTGTGVNIDNKLQIGVVDNSYAWLQAIKPGTMALGLALNPGGGGVMVGRTTSSTSTPAALLVQHTYGVNYGLVLVSDNVGASSVVRFDNPNGNVGSIVVSGTTTTYTTSSDRRLKENITATEGAMDKVMRIPVHDFSFKSDASHKLQTGFIAQELEKVIPEAVTTNGDDGISPLVTNAKAWSVDYGRVTPLLVKAIQELKAVNDNLKAANDDLRATVEAQGADIEALKAAVTFETPTR